jgi:uncharacterized protein YkwD
VTGVDRIVGMPRLRTFCLLLLCLAAPAAAQEAPRADAAEGARAVLLASLNAQRERLGLMPLRLVPELTAAGQSHVADMNAKRYFAATSPDGKAIAAWVAETGYRHGLLVETLARTAAAPAALVASLAREPEKHATSLFHPELRDVGIGIGGGAGGTTYAIVLARAVFDPLADREAARDDLFAHLNEARAAAGLPRLQRDAALDRAAQVAAEALAAGGGTQGRPSALQVARAVGYGRAGMAPRTVAETMVVGTLSAETTVAELLAREAERKVLLDRHMQDGGVGLAVVRDPAGQRLVWVQYLADLVVAHPKRAQVVGPQPLPPGFEPRQLPEGTAVSPP